MKVCFCFWVITAVQLQEKRCSLSTDTRISEVSSSKDAKIWACFHPSPSARSQPSIPVSLNSSYPNQFYSSSSWGSQSQAIKGHSILGKTQAPFSELFCLCTSRVTEFIPTMLWHKKTNVFCPRAPQTPVIASVGRAVESIFGYICFCAFCAQVLKWLGSGEGERSILFSVRSPCVCAEVTSGSYEGWGQSPGGSSLWLEDWSSPRSQPWGRGRGLEGKWTTSGQQSIQSYIHNGTSTETFKKGAQRTSGLVNTSTLEGWPIPTPWRQKTLHLGPSGPCPMYLLIWPFI